MRDLERQSLAPPLDAAGESGRAAARSETDSDRSKRVIWKYVMDVPAKVLPLADTDEILSAGMQDDRIVVWAVRDERKVVKHGRHIVCLNTGVEAPQVIRRCIGTVTSSNGLVWHVLEVGGA